MQLKIISNNMLHQRTASTSCTVKPKKPIKMWIPQEKEQTTT